MLSASGIRTFVGVDERLPIETSKRLSCDPLHSREMDGRDGKLTSGSNKGESSGVALGACGAMKRLGVLLVGILYTGGRFFRGVAMAYRSSTEAACVLSAICLIQTNDY